MAQKRGHSYFHCGPIILYVSFLACMSNPASLFSGDRSPALVKPDPTTEDVHGPNPGTVRLYPQDAHTVLEKHTTDLTEPC